LDTERLRRLASQIRHKEETDRSLRLAETRQRRMLPNPPDLPNYDFAVYYSPASAVSGDFYDFIPVREGAIGIVLGDVSGHGVEAGIIMGMAKQTISIYGRQIEGPLDVLKATNDELFRSLDGKTFVSLSYGVFDTKTRLLRFCRAGQNKPYIMNTKWQNPKPQMVESRGLALGVGKGERFARSIEEIEVTLEDGDLFFQYTDGLVEATNKDKEQFGEERLRDVLTRYARTSCSELVEIMSESLNDFSRSPDQTDDITMVLLKVKDPGAMTRTARFELPKATEQAVPVTARFGTGLVPPPQQQSPPQQPPSAPQAPPPGGVDPSGGLPGWMK
jgi:sigma-B regulation protein RsbU (phosphoserine phosphatase)